MSIIQKVKHAVGLENADQTTEKRYHCPDCDTEFTSFKSQDRAMCIDCMNGQVERLQDGA